MVTAQQRHPPLCGRATGTQGHLRQLPKAKSVQETQPEIVSSHDLSEVGKTGQPGEKSLWYETEPTKPLPSQMTQAEN